MGRRRVSLSVGTAGRRRNHRGHWLAGIAAAFVLSSLLQAQTRPPLLVLQNAPNSAALNSISFGDIALGASVTKAILLSNAGGGTLTFSGIDIRGANAGDYKLGAGTCPKAGLAAGATCTLSVTFRPSAAGKRTAHVLIANSALGSPHLVPLSGSGVDGAAPRKAVGPIDLRIGYPAYYTDQNGLSLAPCVDDPVLCLTPVPDLTRAAAVTDDPVTTNFPDEFFYYILEGVFPNLPGRSLVRLALEGAFNTPEVLPGEQIVFSRVRIRISGLKPGVTYRISHPYGHDDLVAEPDIDGGRINFTDDFGSFASPSDFSEVLTARTWPFLTWAPPSDAPPGFVGDPAALHAITPGPGGNFIRLQELDATGRVVATIDETNLFTVSGRIARGALAPLPPNQPPIANDDTASTTTPNAVTIRVLANDSDPDADPIQLTAVGAAAHGTTSINNNGAFVTYQPDAGFSGVDSFTYDIDDFRGGTATATVTVTVAAGANPPANNPPVAVSDSATTQPGVAVVIGVLRNDSDPDGDAISIVSATNGSRGTTTVNSGLTISYTPAAGFTSGSDTFTYTIGDGRGGLATALVTVTVIPPPPPNRAPVANADAATTKAGVAVNINVLANDTDADGDVLTVSAVQNVVGGVAAIQSDGTVTFTPAAGFSGAASFSYTVVDGRGGSAIGTASITVLPPGLVLALGFNEASGAALDSSLTGNSGTLTGATRVPGKPGFGSAVSFNGLDDLITVAHNATLSLTSGMTLEAWVNPSANTGTGVQSGWRTVILKERGAAGLSYALYGNDGNPTPEQPAGYIRLGTQDRRAGAAPALPLGAWSHVALTYDGAALKLYVGGVLRSSAAMTGSIVTSTAPLRIGGNNVFASEFFQGLIDDVRVYNRSLTAAEIQTDMNTPIQ